MRILWAPRLQSGIDDLHVVTWREMSRELSDRGVEMKILAAGNFSGFQSGVLEQLKNWEFPGGRMLALRIFGPGALIRLVADFRPAVIIFDALTSWMAHQIVALSEDAPLMISDHRTPGDHFFFEKPNYPATILRRKMDRSDWKRVGKVLSGATVITSYYKEFICSEYGIDRKLIGVWGSGASPHFLVSSNDRTIRPGWLKDKIVIMQHGEWSFNRGLLESITALELCSNKDVVLLLIGKGPAEKALRRRIQKSGLAKRVFLIPPVAHNEIPRWLDVADAGIMAYPDSLYWNCNNPIKLLEFLARGTPLILTAMPSFREAASGYEAAIWLKNRHPDPDEIAAAINTVAADPESWKQKGFAGGLEIRANIGWPAQAEKLLSFLEGIGSYNIKGRFK